MSEAVLGGNVDSIKCVRKEESTQSNHLSFHFQKNKNKEQINPSPLKEGGGDYRSFRNQ